MGRGAGSSGALPESGTIGAPIGPEGIPSTDRRPGSASALCRAGAPAGWATPGCDPNAPVD